MKINNIYTKCLNTGNWQNLQSTRAEIICPQEIDFSLEEIKQPDYLRTALKIILFPWLIYEGVRYVIQRMLMTRIYPAQSRLVRLFIPEFRISFLDAQRVKDTAELLKKGFIVRHVCFSHNGRKISGLLMGHKDHIDNGKWVLQATGNIQPIELGAAMTGEFYHSMQYNVLMLNNPGVGRSEGTATPETLGETQEMGLQFLESVLKAKKLIVAGFSLGGGSASEAIRKHTFKPGIEYAVVRQMSFSRVSEVCKQVLQANWAPQVVRWAGCEIDSIKASKKLQALKIPEGIIQCGDEKQQPADDGTIPAAATLQASLQKELPLDETKKIISLPGADHCDQEEIKKGTARFIQDWERKEPHWERKEPSFWAKWGQLFTKGPTVSTTVLR